jgi:hypothetical protein
MQINRENPRSPNLWVRFTSSGPVDTIPSPPAETQPVPSTITCQISGGMSFFSIPFGAQGFFTFTPEGHVLRAWTGAYRMAVVTRSGDTLRVLPGTADRAPISDIEWNSASTDWRAFQSRAPGAACEGAYRRPDHKPALRFAFHDAEARLWVERYGTGGFLWDVWEDGQVVGSLEGPLWDAALEPYARRGRFYAVTRDSLGVQRVRAFRVVRE